MAISTKSTLEALFRKLDSLERVPKGKLAGKICTVIELTSRLPVKVWFHENPYSNDCNFVDDLLNLATAKTLLILDWGFYDFVFFCEPNCPASRFHYSAQIQCLYASGQELNRSFFLTY